MEMPILKSSTPIIFLLFAEFDKLIQNEWFVTFISQIPSLSILPFPLLGREIRSGFVSLFPNFTDFLFTLLYTKIVLENDLSERK